MPNSGDSLAGILALVIQAREQETSRLARRLHDEAGQTISAVGLHLDVLRMDIEETSPEIARRIHDTQQILQQAVEEVRALSYELNPEIVRRIGLEAAMTRLVDSYRRTAGCTIDFSFDDSVILPRETARSLHRIADCALGHAVRHGGKHTVSLRVAASPGRAVLEVRHAGEAGDPELETEENPAFEILLMRYYADLASINLNVTVRPDGGTIILARVPEYLNK